MPTITITATGGAALANVPSLGGGTGADIYAIPQGSVIVITTQRGFGDVTENAIGEDLATAQTDVGAILSLDGVS